MVMDLFVDDVDEESVSGEGAMSFSEFGKWLCAGADAHVSGDGELPCRNNFDTFAFGYNLAYIILVLEASNTNLDPL